MTHRGRTKYVLVLIWSRELCSAQRGRRQSTTSEAIIWGWDHCLALSLCGCMAHRGLAKQHNWLCYLIYASVSLCKDIFQSLAEGHSVRQLDLSSDHLLSNHPWDRFILDMTADTHVGVKNRFVACWLCFLNTLNSLLVPKWSLWIWCFWKKWHFMFLPFF